MAVNLTVHASCPVLGKGGCWASLDPGLWSGGPAGCCVSPAAMGRLRGGEGQSGSLLQGCHGVPLPQVLLHGSGTGHPGGTGASLHLPALAQGRHWARGLRWLRCWALFTVSQGRTAPCGSILRCGREKRPEGAVAGHRGQAQAGWMDWPHSSASAALLGLLASRPVPEAPLSCT